MAALEKEVEQLGLNLDALRALPKAERLKVTQKRLDQS